MNIAAIIAEYNPLHYGHIYHIEETKRRLGGDDTALIAVMSGHTVQRGAFPLLSKFARAEMAVRAGFDLVFELDSPHACAPAERFARGAISLIRQMGIVTHLSFGAECGDLSVLRELAERTPECYPKDMSLAAAMPSMWADAASLFTPNNILGLEYIRGLNALASHIQPLLIQRKGSRHDDDTDSASACRKRLRAGGKPPDLPFLSLYNEEQAAGRTPSSLSRIEAAVLSQLRRMDSEDWSKVPDTGGGLWQRMQKAVQQAGDLAALFSLAKTKRYPLSRLRRTVICAFLGITEAAATAPPPLRLLGIGTKGSRLLPLIQSPILSRAAAHKDILSLESAVTDQFALTLPRPPSMGWEWRSPLYRVRPT